VKDVINCFMQGDSRAKNAIKNMIVAYASMVLNLLFKFGVRTVFVYTLSKEYLGLEGLFSNILVFLSLVELGIGPAITFCLYKPIANNDERTIIALMRLFKKAYWAIGSVIFVLGVSFVPFIDKLIKGNAGLENLQLIYVLFVLNSAISYFFSYKAIFITANQKDYIVQGVRLIVEIIKAVFQVVVLYYTKNYRLFLAVMILSTLFNNVFIAFIADKKYPVLKSDELVELDAENKYLIKENVCALVFHKIGGMVVFSTSHILMSRICGLIAEAIYSNYAMITTGVEGLYGAFFGAIVAGVGNLRVTSDVEQQKYVFNKVFFINFVGIMFATTCLLSMFNPFIVVWIGKEFCFDNSVVYVMVLYFYIRGMRQTAGMFNMAYGFQRFNKYVPIPEIIINLLVSILAAMKWGPIGIFIGSIMSTVLTCMWVEPYILYRHGFQSSLWDYCKRYIQYAVVSFVVVVSSYCICNLIACDGMVGIAERLMICILITVIAVYVIFGRTKEFSELLLVGQRLLKCGHGER